MKITITFKLDNAAFKYDDGTLCQHEVANTVQIVQDHIEEGDTAGTIRDDNGNTVGKWAITGK